MLQTKLIAGSIVLGFALVSVTLATKKNDFDSCYARLSPIVSKNQPNPDLAAVFIVERCSGIPRE